MSEWRIGFLWHQIYDWLEAVVLSAIPALIIVFAVIAVVVRIIDLLVNCLRPGPGPIRPDHFRPDPFHPGSPSPRPAPSIPDINIIPPTIQRPRSRPVSPVPDYSPFPDFEGPSKRTTSTSPSPTLVISGRWSKFLIEDTPEDPMQIIKGASAQNVGGLQADSRDENWDQNVLRPWPLTVGHDATPRFSKMCVWDYLSNTETENKVHGSAV